MFLDEYDGASNCASYLTFRNEKVVGSVRACMYDPLKTLPIPIMDVFYHEIEQSIGFDNSMIEVNKLVVAPYFQRRGGVFIPFEISFRRVCGVTLAIPIISAPFFSSRCSALFK